MIRIWLSKAKIVDYSGLINIRGPMLNKCLLVPVLVLKLKTALAIKSGLTLFGLGLGAGYFFNPSRQKRPSDNDTSTSISDPKQRAVPAKKKGTKT